MLMTDFTSHPSSNLDAVRIWQERPGALKATIIEKIWLYPARSELSLTAFKFVVQRAVA